MTSFNADELHVVLDAVTALRSEIINGHRPWAEYDPYGPDDPKCGANTYLALCESITSKTTVELNRADR